MRKVMVAFNTVEEVAAFVKDMSRFPEEVHIDLVSGRHVVNARSLINIFTLDLSKPIEVNIKSDSPNLFLINKVVEKCMEYGE